MTGPLHELGREVQRDLGDGAEAVAPLQQRAVVLERLARDRRRRRTIRWGVGMVGGLAAATAAILLVLGTTLSRSAESEIACRIRGGAALAAGDWIEAQSAPLAFDFDEGSAVALDLGSRARLVHAKVGEVRVVLESGRLRSTVKSAAERRWVFHAGPYRVRVTGTRLGVAWDTAAKLLSVEVTRGAVRVSGGNVGSRGLTVRAGEQLHADYKRALVQLSRVGTDLPAPTTDAQQLQTDAAADAGAAGSRPDARREPAAPPRAQLPYDALVAPWRAQAEQGHYASAYAAVRRIGPGKLLRRLRSADLMLLADAARLGGNPKLARRALLAVRRRFARQAAAPVAAFRLGRLSFEQLVDYPAAVKWFRVFIREAPNDRLVGAARGRLVMALWRAGDRGAARRAAQEYLRRYPAGSYRAAAESVLTQTASP